jgi:hypothetical protein
VKVVFELPKGHPIEMNSHINSQLDPFLSEERERSIENEKYFRRGQIVGICESILAEEMGIIPGSRRLSGLGLKLFDGHDEDFVAFDAIASETDHLPVDSERHNWSVEALEGKDKEIARAESLYKSDAFAACKKLVERFGLKGEG